MDGLLTGAERRVALAAGVVALVLMAGLVAAAVLPLLLATAAPSAAPQPAGLSAFDAYVWRVARFTLVQAVLSTALSLMAAIPVALAVARRRFFGRRWLIRLMALPLGLPPIVAALALVEVWGRQGVINQALTAAGLADPISIYGLPGILLAHVFFNMPLAARLILFELERVPAEYWALAGQLGMRRMAIFRFVEWPLMRRILPGVAGLVLMLCATSFTLVLLLGGGPSATTIEVAIYQALRFDFDPPRAIALALLQIALTGVILIALRLVGGAAEEGTTAGRSAMRHDRDSPAAKTFDATMIGFGAAFLIVPLAAIVAAGLTADFGRLVGEPIVWRAVATSLVLASVSAGLSIVLVGALIHARNAAAVSAPKRLSARLFSAGAGAAASLILLVPPIVLGAGWFILMSGRIDALSMAPVVVVLVNALMAMPFVMRVLEPAYRSHTRRTARLAMSLGLSGFRRWRWIDWPGLRGAFAIAAAFAMALSLGDLGAIALFGSRQTVTLPYLILERMGSYRTSDAAGLSLVLGLICLVLMSLGARRAERSGAGL